MKKNSGIFVAGHRGMVGTALVRRLEAGGYSNVLTRTRAELDLGSQVDVNDFFKQKKLHVFHKSIK